MPLVRGVSKRLCPTRPGARCGRGSTAGAASAQTASFAALKQASQEAGPARSSLVPSGHFVPTARDARSQATAELGVEVRQLTRRGRCLDDEYRRPVSGVQRVRSGYLLLADISGYTAFLVGTELEHANAIVRELTTLVRVRLSPPLRFVKLEGDAVFCYADGATFEDGERLVELIETCYFDFSNRLLDMERETTCRCAACASIGLLDLKFVAHYGAYVIDSKDDREDLAGPDVILVHRLLKNTVSDGGGPRAYAFLTEPCLRGMPSGSTSPRTANPTSHWAA